MTRVGQYRILDRIGEGGMGAVFRGEDTMLQRQVAIKVLRPELSKQKSLVERFRTEAVALARLNHPNIATVYGLLQQDGQYYMVLEYVDGQTLEAMLSRRGRLPWNEAVQVAKDTLAALDHAHRMGVIHRDLKPANLMVTRSGQLKVMDFGIARLAGTSRHTEYGRIVGTPLYMSPEQLRGEEVDGRSDVYSLGVVLYELLTGREAFQADSDYALLMAQLNTMPEPIGRYVANLPSALEMAIDRALMKARDDRWKSATEFRRALIQIAPEPITRSTEEVPIPGPAKETVVASDPDEPVTAGAAPATRLAEPAGAPATRLVGGDVPVTRLADGPSPASPASSWLSRGRNRTVASSAAVAMIAAIIWAGTRPPRVVPTPPPAPAPAATPSPAPAPTPAPPPPPPAAAVVGLNPGGPGQRPSPPAPPPANYGELVDPNAPSKKAPPPKSGPKPSAPSPSPSPSPAPSPPAAAVDTPNVTPPASPTESVDLSGATAAFRAGWTQIAGWLKGRDQAQVDRSFAGTDAEKKALAKLLAAFPVELEKESLASTSPSGPGRAVAEFSATMKWRSSFGNTRKIPVRIAATFAAEGASWRLRSWRFLGTPDLD